ncbi:MAG: hypothetical protein ACE5K4_11505 [Candidatus Hydrothermarchaeota archaeon]
MSEFLFNVSILVGFLIIWGVLARKFGLGCGGCHGGHKKSSEDVQNEKSCHK